MFQLTMPTWLVELSRFPHSDWVLLLLSTMCLCISPCSLVRTCRLDFIAPTQFIGFHVFILNLGWREGVYLVYLSRNASLIWVGHYLQYFSYICLWASKNHFPFVKCRSSTLNVGKPLSKSFFLFSSVPFFLFLIFFMCLIIFNQGFQSLTIN